MIKVVIAPIGKNERVDVENIEGCEFASIQDVPLKNFEHLELSEFTEACNNEEINLEQNWIGFVRVVA